MTEVLVWVQVPDDHALQGGHWRWPNDPTCVLAHLRAQVDNAFRFGRRPGEIRVCTNFPFEYRGVSNHRIANVITRSAWLNKIEAVNELIVSESVADDIWLHDVDAWQVAEFRPPDNCDVATATFPNGRPHGASVFWKSSGFDLQCQLRQMVMAGGSGNDEHHMAALFASCPHRWLRLDRAWCASCRQLDRIETRPIRVVHFKPEQSPSELGYVTPRDGTRLVDEALLSILRRHGFQKDGHYHAS